VARPWRLLVFGATGAIGGTVVSHAVAAGWQVVAVSRSDPPSAPEGAAWLRYDPLRAGDAAVLDGQAPFDAVCFAQGANMADAVNGFDADAHLALYRANCLSVMQGCADLVRAGLLSADGARIVVVSSIWQDRARGDKLSYTVTKAAIGGFVRSASVDLGADGHLVNGVLPGVLDTPMTQANLSAEQIDRVRAKTGVGRLPDLDTLAETILFLCSERNASISGQSLAVDLGMTNANLL
jgi:hypothetical protein